MVSMVYHEFKLDMSFDGGYRDYMAVVTMVCHEFKLDMSFVKGCRGYVAVLSAVIPFLDDANMFDAIEWRVVLMTHDLQIPTGLCR